MAWIYKPDGSRQCTGTPGTTSDEAKTELKGLIGEEHIQAIFKVGLFVVQLCGLPTGLCHVANIDDAGLELLLTGIVGPDGWAPWPFSDDPSAMRIGEQHPFLARVADPGMPFPMRTGPEVPFPLKFDIPEIERNGGGAVTFEPGRAAIIPEIIKTLTSVGSAPSTLRDLIGYRLRVVHADDPDPLIFYHARVNVHVDDDDRIVDISFH